MKMIAWNRSFLLIACALISVGVAPVTYLAWFANCHNFTPLSVPLSLGVGEYTLPSFSTDLKLPYSLVLVSDRILDGQEASCLEGAKVIDSDRCRGAGRILVMNWKIVSNTGSIIQQGSYNDRIYSGDEVWLGVYSPKRGEHPKVILRIYQDVPGYDAAHSKLEIRANVAYTEFLCDKLWYATAWAVVIGLPGIIMLLAILKRSGLAPRIRIP